MIKDELNGDVYMVLKDGEFAGWFSIPVGDSSTEILRAALSSNPTIIDMATIDLDVPDLPAGAEGFFWNGTSFEKR